MSVSVEIIPSADCVAMVGHSEVYKSYSLSGSVLLRFKRPLALLQCYQPLMYSLSSLELVFEGQHEVVEPSGGFASMRPCRMVRNLVPPCTTPVTLSSEVQQWSVPFDLAVPAWIPPSWLGTDGRTSYHLHATAYFVAHYVLDSLDSALELGNIYPLKGGSVSRSLMQKMTPFCLGRGFPKSKPKVFRADPVAIAVGRFRSPLHDDDSLPPRDGELSLFPLRFFSLDPKLSMTPSELNDDIQLELFQSLKITVGVPSWVGVEEEAVAVCMQVDSCLPVEMLKKHDLRVTKLSFSVQEIENYQSFATPEYLAVHPIPTVEHQPDTLPFQIPSTLGNLTAAGLIPPSRHSRWTRESKLDYACEPYAFNFALHSEAMRARVRVPLNKRRKDGQLWPDMISPYATVKHVVSVSMECAYRDGAGERRSESLYGDIPLRFTAISSSNHSSSPTSPAFDIPVSQFHDKKKAGMKILPPVPAYAQLFDQHGNTRCPSPLPRYEPKMAPEPDSVPLSSHASDQFRHSNISQSAVAIAL